MLVVGTSAGIGFLVLAAIGFVVYRKYCHPKDSGSYVPGERKDIA